MRSTPLYSPALFLRGEDWLEKDKCTMDAEATVCDINEGWLRQDGGSTGTALRGDNGQHPQLGTPFKSFAFQY